MSGSLDAGVNPAREPLKGIPGTARTSACATFFHE
jgi:hypothetical protein